MISKHLTTKNKIFTFEEYEKIISTQDAVSKWSDLQTDFELRYLERLGVRVDIAVAVSAMSQALSIAIYIFYDKKLTCASNKKSSHNLFLILRSNSKFDYISDINNCINNEIVVLSELEKIFWNIKFQIKGPEKFKKTKIIQNLSSSKFQNCEIKFITNPSQIKVLDKFFTSSLKRLATISTTTVPTKNIKSFSPKIVNQKNDNLSISKSSINSKSQIKKNIIEI